jgi:hypothetical protein
MSGTRRFKKNKQVKLPKWFRANISKAHHMLTGRLQRAVEQETFDDVQTPIVLESDGTVIVTGRSEIGRVIPPKK